MGKLVVTEFISLDGIIEDPGGAEGTEQGGWSFRHPADEGQAFKGEELERADAQLLGRVTYEGFAAAWPAMEDTTGEFGKKMNAMPKVVVSTTLTEATWNNTTIISGDLAAEVGRMKEQYQGDILVAGSATLVHALTEAGPGRRVPPDGPPGRARHGQAAVRRGQRRARTWNWSSRARRARTCCC